LRPLDIEFQPSKSLATRLTPWIASACLAVAVIQVYLVVAWHKESLALKEEILAAKAKMQALRSLQAPSIIPLSYREGAKQALRISSFPLQSVMASLEGISVPGVKVISLEINLNQGFAKAEIESVSPQDLESYFTQLIAIDPILNWTVISIQDTVGSGPIVGRAGSLINGSLFSPITSTDSSPKAVNSYRVSLESRLGGFSPRQEKP